MSSLQFGYHYHIYCITKEDLRKYAIANDWTVLACNEDDDKLEFINFIEHNRWVVDCAKCKIANSPYLNFRYPFYGSQIHPERVAYENFGPQDSCHHCSECFELTQYFAKFFVQQCSLNGASGGQAALIDCKNYSIHNFSRINSALTNQHWCECYLFKPSDNYLNESN